MKPRLLLLLAVPVLALAQPPPVNLDNHPGMKLSGMNAATADEHVMAAAVVAPASSGIQPVFTRSGSNLRYGTYLKETRLTPGVVRAGLSLLATIPIPGDQHPEAQPLFAARA